MGCAQEIDSLCIFFVELGGLDVDHDLDNIVSYLREGIFANCGTNDRDSLNYLASELLVLWLEELV